MEDEKIVALYLERDESAISCTAEKYGARLRGLALHILMDSSASEECENDTYFQAWSLIPPHKPVSYLYAFLARITRHLSLNYCRERNRLKRKAFLVEFSDELEQCIPGPDDTPSRVEAKLLRESISRFLRKQPEEKRNVFLRRYWYLDSVGEIARRFSMSQSKVKTMLFRTRQELRTYLEQEGIRV